MYVANPTYWKSGYYSIYHKQKYILTITTKRNFINRHKFYTVYQSCSPGVSRPIFCSLGLGLGTAGLGLGLGLEVSLMYLPNHFIWLLVFASYSSNKISNIIKPWSTFHCDYFDFTPVSRPSLAMTSSNVCSVSSAACTVCQLRPHLKADTHFIVPWRGEGWVDLCGYYTPRCFTHPSTNWAQYRVTFLIETNALSPCQTANHELLYIISFLTKTEQWTYQNVCLHSKTVYIQTGTACHTLVSVLFYMEVEIHSRNVHTLHWSMDGSPETPYKNMKNKNIS